VGAPSAVSRKVKRLSVKRVSVQEPASTAFMETSSSMSAQNSRHQHARCSRSRSPTTPPAIGERLGKGEGAEPVETVLPVGHRCRAREKKRNFAARMRD
jgi:hypothetical protein